MYILKDNVGLFWFRDLKLNLVCYVIKNNVRFVNYFGCALKNQINPNTDKYLHIIAMQKRIINELWLVL
jgi:hypothetical protein